MLHLADQLITKGLTLTILITPKNLQFLNPILSKHPMIKTLVLNLPEHPKIPLGFENIKDLGNLKNVPMINALGKLYTQIVEWFYGLDVKVRPVAIVSDFFLGWTEKLSNEIGVRRIGFYTSSVFLMEVLCYSWIDIENVVKLDFVEFNELPGKPVFRNVDLPTMVRKYNQFDSDWEFVKESIIGGLKSWGVIFNTFYDIDGVYFDHCIEKMEHQKCWSVGPLRLMCEFQTGEHIERRRNEVLKWLDDCPDGSVVYVCFGSQKMLNKEQIEALGKALELSGSRFLWIVKQGTTTVHIKEGYGHVSNEFITRVAERGKVVKGWISQDDVLKHESVAYFITHCGWNSVLEGVVGGVGLLTWPMEADQFVNAKMLEEKGVAVRVCEGDETVPDFETLAKTIVDVMNGDQSLLFRAKELGEKARVAVAKGGRSVADLDRLVEDLKQLKNK